MFDDVKQEDQNSQNAPLTNSLVQKPDVPSQPAQPTDQNPPAAPKPVESNKVSIDDMFNDIDPVNQPQDSADKPSAVAGGKLQPVQNTAAPKLPEQAANVNQILVEDHDKSGIMKKIIIAAVGIILVIAAAWAAYAFIFTDEEQPGADQTPPASNEQANMPSENNTVVFPEEEEEIITDKDDDADGLTNAEELILATNPNNPDTDDDGLFDREEVKTYRTDPLSPDTDNDGLFDRLEIFVWGTGVLDPDTDKDGYLDGVEIENGYNPLGEGLLTEDQIGEITIE